MLRMKELLTFATSAAGLLLLAAPAPAEVLPQCPSPLPPGVICKHLSAGDGFGVMADGSPMYIFGFNDVTGVPPGDVMLAGKLKANIPAPTLMGKEGEQMYLSLTNVGMTMRPDLFDPHSVHYHGIPNATNIFDGLPESAVTINQGSTYTYYYNFVEPGTYLYHCHVEATEHMQMGMLGQFYVLPRQNDLPTQTFPNGFPHVQGNKYVYNDGDGSTYYDVEFPLQISGMDPAFHKADLTVQPLDFANMKDVYPLINGRGYPDTVDPGAILNQDGFAAQPLHARIIIDKATQKKVLLRISSVETVEYSTIRVLGIPMRVVGHGAKVLKGPGGASVQYDTSSVTLGGGETADVILDVTNVAPGTYALYTTNLHHLSNWSEDFGGMMTEIVVN